MTSSFLKFHMQSVLQRMKETREDHKYSLKHNSAIRHTEDLEEHQYKCSQREKELNKKLEMQRECCKKIQKPPNIKNNNAKKIDSKCSCVLL